ncbi:hypothetical protein [Baekduia sp.]|jgi:hypothetical protein|uniref:hypothetical protein n=1 Tax=Baekduia sp. TaxID=2600305 RepID=UPI002DFA59F5|nr:hypothetical protein [Baekduia sp.]
MSDHGHDHTEDPRKQEQGSGGYPESTPAGTEGDTTGRPDEHGGDDRAPSPSTEKEADREHSTGNPDAAG